MNFALCSSSLDLSNLSFLGLKCSHDSCSDMLLTKSFVVQDSWDGSSKKKMAVCSHLMPGHLEGSFMGEKRFEEAPRKLGFVRTLLVDNYDSYTYNIYQELSVVNGVPPVVVKNDEWTWEQVCYYLYEEKAFDNIVISPGPGSPTCAADIGICLRLLLECRDIPILGVCLGYQALGYVHGAQIVHASEPVHGRMSEIEHNGCKLFNNIPSGPKSGFKVVRYHSLVIDADSLPEDLVPIAWTTSAGIHSFLESQSSDTWSYSLSEEVQMKKILMGIKHSTRPHYGLQFHPESIATCHGRQIFENFREMTQKHRQRLRSTFVNERNAIYAAASSKKEKSLPGITMEIYHQLPKTFPVRVVHPSPRKSRSFSFTVTNSKYKTESEDRNRMFILGMGYVGQVFARNLRNEDWMVTGTSTSTAKKEELKERGFDICLFDTNEPQLSTLNTLKSCTHLLVSIPSVVGVGDPLLQHDELLRSTLMDGNLQWLCYLSSTSVYGDCGGAWVNEDYSTSPTSETAKARLAAEEGWINLGTSLGISTQIFRLGGIYGPGRSAIDTIIKQEPISRSQKMRISKKYTSRVHVDDICQALKASIHRLPFRRIYNIVDDDPAPRDEVFAYARELVEKKWPTWAEHNTFTEKAISYNRRGEKRVSNDRMKKELGVRLLHPSYKSGLLNIIDQMEYPSSEK